jgi:hypothetical protein
MDKLDQSSWKTPATLILCKNDKCCKPQTRATHPQDLSFEWNSLVPFMADGLCNLCNTSFSVCTLCPKALAQYPNRDSIMRHCRNVHLQWLNDSNILLKRASKRKSNTTLQRPPRSIDNAPIEYTAAPIVNMDDSTETIIFDDNESLGEPAFLATDVNQNLPVILPIKRVADIGTGTRHNNAAYFFNESQRPGGGLEYLVGMSKFGMTDLAGELDPAEVKMYVQTAEMAGILTRPNRDRLAQLTKSICDVVENQTKEELEIQAGTKPRRPFIIRPLKTPNEIRSQLYDKSTALFRILPQPPLFECEDHAYSLYSDCVRDALGKGYDLDLVHPLTGAETNPVPVYPLSKISATSQCLRLFDLRGPIEGQASYPLVNLWMNDWSDDAEPNNSKNNRGSFWFKSVTISPTRKLIHSMSHTYPLAMGHKHADHEHVGKCLRADLLMLGTKEGVPMYSLAHQGIVMVRARLFASLMDQPERRGENHLIGGNSLFHRRFGYSFPWHEFENVLRPCPLCYDMLLDESVEWECPDCPDCTNFAFNPQHPLFVHDPDDNFPIPMLPGEQLHPLKLTYELLSNAVHLSHNNVVDGLWSQDEAEAYLQWHCLRKKSLEIILVHAERCQDFNDIMNDPSTTEEEKTAVAAERNRCPWLYEPWPIPSLWSRGVLLEQCPDVPMHLLFLGIVKTVLLRVEAWMANKRKADPFARQMKDLLFSVEELKLSWIKILAYRGGKFGGWVSENYLAMSRILKWFYSLLHRIASDKKIWVEPVDKPKDKWPAKDNKSWLQARGLNTDGRYLVLRARVLHYMTQVDPVPPVVEMLAGPVETVMSTVSSLDELISLFMVEEVPNEQYYNRLERKIRIFLTHFADMEDKLPRKREMPQWLSSFNFLSLLNLPGIVREYGPIRNIWEGGPQGEGVLRFVKPNMLNGLRRAWEIASMKTLMRKKAMMSVADPFFGTEASVTDWHPKMFHPYTQDVQSMDDALRGAREVISCIALDDGRWGICCRIDSEDCFIALERSVLPEVELFGLNYFIWKRQLGIGEEILQHPSIVAYCLLLPLLQYQLQHGEEGFKTHCYSIIDSNHRILDDSGHLNHA